MLEKLPFRLEVIQTDNGAGFHWHALDHGIQHVYIKRAAPRRTGKVERSHRVDANEFYLMLTASWRERQSVYTRLEEREHFYNFQRPHGTLGGQTPMSGYVKRPPPLVSALIVSCTRSAYHPRANRC